jgi:hypothetical protein
MRYIKAAYDAMVWVVENYDALVELFEYYIENEEKFANLVDLVNTALD